MHCLFKAGLLLICLVFFEDADAKSCVPKGYGLGALRELAAQEFVIKDDSERERLSLQLLSCLSDPDSELRDDIAYKAYVYWMRNKALSTATLREISERLQVALKSGDVGGKGFGQPFSALVLSEVARTDRKDPWMSAQERSRLLENATWYLSSVRDYRGFDEKQGWRHGVAHGSDLMLQLALNPALDKQQLDLILSAIASQINAHDSHFYIYGEAERLAAPVYYIARRKLHSKAQWQSWFTALTIPPAPVTKDTVYKSQQGLAWRHNTQAFIVQMYIVGKEDSDNEVRELLATATLDALKALD